MAMSSSDIIRKAEDFADTVLRQSKHILPHLARFCLVATFFEDGIRMWYQWVEQREYIDHQWNCGYIIGTLFCLVNLFGQLARCFMVLARIKVEAAVGLLFAIIVIQTIAYQVFTDIKFFFKELSVVWWTHSSVGRISSRSSKRLCWCSNSRHAQQTQDVYATHWSRSIAPHVSHVSQVRHVLLPYSL